LLTGRWRGGHQGAPPIGASRQGIGDVRVNGMREQVRVRAASVTATGTAALAARYKVPAAATMPQRQPAA